MAVLLLSAGQGFFLALALITSKTGNWLANRYLGVFTLLIAFAVLDISLPTDSESFAFFSRSVFWPRDYVYGPALYFYVREMTLPVRYPLVPRQWLHFFPAICHAALYWTMPLFNESMHAAILTDSFNPETSLAQYLISFEVFSAILHVALYLWLSVRVLSRHEARIKDNFSYIERINLRWLRRLLLGVIAVYVVWVLEEFISELVGLEDTFFMLLGVSMVVLIYAMSYLGLRQPVIFTGDTTQHVNEAQEAPRDDTKYKTSSLSPVLSEGLLDELQQLMNSDKPYLDSKLSLPRLAKELRVSVNYLSQVINEQLNQNFFDFVNSYRIEEAKARLTDEKSKTDNILTIATDAGFNSKSAFYAAFKKHTGMTPGEFRKRCNA